MKKNLLRAIALSAVSMMGTVAMQGSETFPDPGKWYRIATRATDHRGGWVIELLNENSNPSTTANNNDSKIDRLWSSPQVAEDSPAYDYQLWRFQEDPANPGLYAMICKAGVEGGSVNGTPTGLINSGRWDYTNTLCYDFKFDLDGSYQGNNYHGDIDGVHFTAIQSQKQTNGWYMNVAAAGQSYAINCYNEPADGLSGLFLFHPVADVEPADPNVYVTFEAYRKGEIGTNTRWGVYLQDGTELVTGTPGQGAKQSTLCGSEDLTANTIWQITPGTAEGSFHVQNWVTKKYLVKLIAYGSQTVDEPVDIWFPELTKDGQTGVQICTSATPSSNPANCLDADNCDRLVGAWANDNGNLWFKSQIDATNDAEVEAFLARANTPDLSEAILEAVTKVETIANTYLENIPFASDDVRDAVALLATVKANPGAYSENFESEADVKAYFDDMLGLIEDGLIEDIEAKLVAGYAFSFRVLDLVSQEKPSYLSSSVAGFGSSSGAFLFTNEISAGNLFRPEVLTTTSASGHKQFNLFTLNTDKQLCNSFYDGSSSFGPYLNGNSFKQKLPLTFELRDGYVNVVFDAEGSKYAFSYNSQYDYAGSVSKTDAKARLSIQAYSVEETADLANAQLAKWGAAMPEGKAVAKENAAKISAAEDLASIATLIAEVKGAMMAKLVAAPVTLKSIATDLYVGYEGNTWYANYPEDEAPEWTVSTATDPAAFPDYYLLKTDGKYIGYNLAASDAATESGSYNSSFFGIIFDNPGNITIAKPNSKNGISLNESKDKLAYSLTYDKRFIEGIDMYSFSFAGPEDNSEKIAYIEAKIEEAKALAELYKKSVPFAEEGINLVCALLEFTTPESFLEEFESEEQFDEYFQENLISTLEEVVLQALAANADKPWTLYQDIQKAYLSATTKATNQGYDSFNYQAEADNNTAWTLVPAGEDGQYFLKSIKGQYIGTPKVHYCQVLDQQPEAPNGVFTIGVSEGYVVFNSVAQSGSVLGFDCKNDPVEIMTFGTSPKGYLWQIAIAEVTASEVAVNVTPAAGEVKSLGRITFAIEGADYGVDADCTESVVFAKDGNAVITLDAAKLAENFADGAYYVDANVAEYTAGTYTLTIPEGIFKGLTVYNAATTVTWTITADGIIDITVEAANGNVYDLQGRRVINPTKGLYIINNQKHLVK